MANGSPCILLLSAIHSLLAATDFCSYPLGLQNGNFPDSHFSSGSSLASHKPWYARLNYSKAWCSSSTNGDLTILFGQAMKITKIAIQGDGINSLATPLSLKFAFSKYEQQVLNAFGSLKILNGGSDAKSIQFEDLSDAPFCAERLIIRILNYRVRPCLRTELYGCPLVCSKGLGFEFNQTYPPRAKFQTSSNTLQNESRLNGMKSWCARSSVPGQEFLGIDLGRVMSVSGIATQGSPVKEAWAKTFSVYYGDSLESIVPMESHGIVQIFSGNWDQNTISTLWFNFTLETRYIRIFGMKVHNEFCMRLEVMGCPNDCVKPLGLEKDVLPSHAFKVSSSSSPQNARLNSIVAWCGNSIGNSLVGVEWVSVDLMNTFELRAIAIQGQHGNERNYFKSFKLEYSYNGINYRYVKERDSNNDMIFPGISSRQEIKFHYFENGGIAARHIRIRAREIVGLKQCVRFELYGCLQHCGKSLGIKMGAQLPSSTTIASWISGDPDIRNRSRLGGRGWCYSIHHQNQYFAIGFKSHHIIRGIALQGGNRPNLWISQFTIRYTGKGVESPVEPSQFTQLSGRYRINSFYFKPWVLSNYIKVVISQTRGNRPACFRADLYGCKYDCFDSVFRDAKELTASSYMIMASNPSQSRLNSLTGSWKPCFKRNPCASRSSPEAIAREYIQICRKEVWAVFGVIVQGGGEGTFQYVQSFGLRFAYSNTSAFHWYKVNSDFQAFHVDIGKYGSEQVSLPVAVYARCFRLVILQPEEPGVALRWDLLGCRRSVKPSLTFPTNPISVVSGQEVRISCKANGQTGVYLDFTFNDTVISNKSGPSVSTFPSNGSLGSGLTKSLHFVATTDNIPVGLGHCVPTTLFNRHGSYDCAFRLGCTASYLSASTTVKRHALLRIIGLSGNDITPRSFRFTAVLSTSVNLTWEHPKDSFALKHYRLETFHNGKRSNSMIIKLASATIAGLNPNAKYTFNLTYIGQGNEESIPVSLSTKTEELAPAAPTNLRIEAFGSDYITVTWNPPLSPFWNLSKQRLRLTNKNTGIRQITIVESTTTRMRFTSLHGYTIYTFEIQGLAKNGLLEGRWSSTISTRTEEGAPGEPSILSLGITNTSTVISWNPPSPRNGIISNYLVQFSSVHLGDNSTRMNFSAHVFTHTFRNLQPFTQYQAKVRAFTKGGRLVGPWSRILTIKTFQGVPMPPQNIKLSSATTSINVTWEAPVPPLGVLSRYQVAYGTNTASLNMSVYLSNERRIAVLDSLKPFTVYRVKMKTYSNQDKLQSKWSEEIHLRTLEGNSSAPIIASRLLFITNFVYISWRIPMEPNGIISQYKIHVVGKKSYNSSFTFTRFFSTSDKNFTFKIFPGTRYNLQLYAINGAGRGKSASSVFYQQAQAPPKSTIELKSTIYGQEIILFPTSDINGEIRRHELILLKSPVNCDYLGTNPMPHTWMVFKEKFMTKRIEIIRGTERANGTTFNLPLIGRSVFCYRAVTVEMNKIIIGKAGSLSIERRSLGRPKDVDVAKISDTSFPVELLELHNQNISYYQVMVAVLPDDNSILIDPEDYPPSKLKPAGKQSTETIYIAAEFSALAFYKEFIVGDGKTYSRQTRSRRDTGNPEVYTNVDLKAGEYYAVFQRAIDDKGVFYTGPWIGPVKTKPSQSATDESSSNIAVAVGGAVGGLLLLAIVGIVIYCFYKRRRGTTNDSLKDKTAGKVAKKPENVRYTLKKQSPQPSEEYALPNLGDPDNTWQSAGRQNAAFVSDEGEYLGPTPISPETSKQPIYVNIGKSDAIYANTISSDSVTYVNQSHKDPRKHGKSAPTHQENYCLADKNVQNLPSSHVPRESYQLAISNTPGKAQPLDYEPSLYEEIACNDKVTNSRSQRFPNHGQSTQITDRNLATKLSELERFDSKRMNGYQVQFENLKRPGTSNQDSDYQQGRTAKNRNKNRVEDILPKDIYRVKLDDRHSKDNNDYINAISIEGSEVNENYIITQYPLKNTVQDFWRLVYQEKCGIMVILNKTTGDKQKYPTAVPESGKTNRFGSIEVRCESDRNDGRFSVKRLSITHSNEPQCNFLCHVFHFLQWTDQGIPNGTGKMLKLIDEMHSLQLTSRLTAPILIVCSDGAGFSGTFLTMVMCGIAFMKEKKFDIYQTIDMLREYRPQFVANVAQYKYCHDYMKAYVKSITDTFHLR